MRSAILFCPTRAPLACLEFAARAFARGPNWKLRGYAEDSGEGRWILGAVEGWRCRPLRTRPLASPASKSWDDDFFVVRLVAAVRKSI
jgi:6-phosphogluconate dehydrogenase (decarboxylating)